MPKDHVFTIRQRGEQVWKVMADGKIVTAEWPDRGSALAGLRTQQNRNAAVAAKIQA